MFWPFLVALRKESVDRNLIGCVDRAINVVALRKESVDRNCLWAWMGGLSCNVALRKESVDRNVLIVGKQSRGIVALRKESVDRNGMEINGVSYDVWSLSARRAWIEISRAASCQQRNHRRSPQGERG